MSDTTEMDLDIVTERSDVLSLPPNTEVEVQGTVKRTTRMPKTTPHSYTLVGVIHLGTKSGDVQVMVNDPNCAISDGPMAHIAGKPVMIGDMIRIHATSTDQPGTLDANDAPIYLSAPSTERLEKYEMLRDKVFGRLLRFYELVQVKDYDQARQVFADIRKLELTDDEAEELKASIEGFPLEERPVHFETTELARIIEDAYERNVETMNGEQFLIFANDAISKMISCNGLGTSESIHMIIYAFLRLDQFTPAQAADLFAEAIDEATLQLLADDQDKLDEYTDLMLTSVQFLGASDAVEAYGKLVDIAEWCLRSGMYEQDELDVKAHRIRLRFNPLLPATFDAIAQIFGRNPDFHMRQHDTLWQWEDGLAFGKATTPVMASFNPLVMVSKPDYRLD